MNGRGDNFSNGNCDDCGEYCSVNGEHNISSPESNFPTVLIFNDTDEFVFANTNDVANPFEIDPALELALHAQSTTESGLPDIEPPLPAKSTVPPERETAVTDDHSMDFML
ncbi:MAG: hypothetical protein AB3N22_22815 [Ruegeria sp.]